MSVGYYAVEGPWGGSGGNAWTDGTYGEITRITLYVGDIINSFQIQYQLRGRDGVQTVTPPQHGRSVGNQQTIDLTEGEYVTKIKGTVGTYAGNQVVTALTIITNVKQYGPYGIGGGTAFESKGDGKVVGFHGRNGDNLDQIGVFTFHV